MSVEADLDNVASSEPLAEEVLIAGESHTQLSDAIDQLPEKYRIPFVMAYQVHLSYDELMLGYCCCGQNYSCAQSLRNLRRGNRHEAPNPTAADAVRRICSAPD